MEGNRTVNPVIRRATPEDIPLIRELAGVCFRDTYRRIPEQMEYMMDWMYSEHSLQKQMEQDGHIYFITSLEGVPCAYFSVQPLGLQDDGAYLFEFQKMYLLPAYKGKGIGRHMVEHVFQFVRDAALPHRTACQPLQPDRELPQTHGILHSPGGRFPHRERLLYERLHHGYLLLSSRTYQIDRTVNALISSGSMGLSILTALLMGT